MDANQLIKNRAVDPDFAVTYSLTPTDEFGDDAGPTQYFYKQADFIAAVAACTGSFAAEKCVSDED